MRQRPNMKPSRVSQPRRRGELMQRSSRQPLDQFPIRTWAMNVRLRLPIASPQERGATPEQNSLTRHPANYSKPAHNSGSNAPPPFIDDLFDVSDRSVMPMVVQKKHLIEPHTGDDKGARARQAFRGAGFEGTGLDDALEEQLDGFAPIGIEVTVPRVRIRRQ